jgi:transcriptional repressor NrdR
VPSNRVGDFVMRELQKLDKIAYIRFASVYHAFETPDDFREAVQEVKAARKRRK